MQVGRSHSRCYMSRMNLDLHFSACVDVCDHDRLRLRIFPPIAECYQAIYKDYNLVTRYQVVGLTLFYYLFLNVFLILK